MLKRLFNNTKASEYTVLIVDDDPALAQMVTSMLRNEGFVVHSAVNGEEALKLLDQLTRPDLFILDLKMPHMDGNEFLEKARIRFGKGALPPVLLLTASKEGEAVANQLGTNDFLPKPFDSDTLIQHVWALVSKVEE